MVLMSVFVRTRSWFTYAHFPLPGESRTVKITSPPTPTVPPSTLTTGGSSSSRIVPWCVNNKLPSPANTAFVGFDSRSLNGSLSSCAVSSRVCTETVFSVSPGAKISVPAPGT